MEFDVGDLVLIKRVIRNSPDVFVLTHVLSINKSWNSADTITYMYNGTLCWEYANNVRFPTKLERTLF